MKFISSMFFVFILIVGDSTFAINDVNFSLKGNNTHNCCKDYCSFAASGKKEPKFSNYEKKKVLLKALGNVDEVYLNFAKKVIVNFFGFECHVANSEPVREEIYVKGMDKVINAEVFLKIYYSKEKIVYLCSEKIFLRDQFIKGYASQSGGTALVRADFSILEETLKHEIGHTLGLQHCDNLSCIMAINNDEYETGQFCTKCLHLLHWQ